jgi:hypothetical protein
MTTMISNQTNQIAALSDAELDNVAGGFNFLNFLLHRHVSPPAGMPRAAIFAPATPLHP